MSALAEKTKAIIADDRRENLIPNTVVPRGSRLTAIFNEGPYVSTAEFINRPRPGFEMSTQITVTNAIATGLTAIFKLGRRPQIG